MKKEKICKKCKNPRGHDKMIALCMDCYYQREKEKPVKIYELKKTPVKKYGRKTKERIKEFGSEGKLHDKVWDTRPHICSVCKTGIEKRHPSCFAHILGKRDYPKFRYLVENISLVHGVFEVNEKTGSNFQCHSKRDTETAGNKLSISKKLQEIVDNLEKNLTAGN